MKPLQILQQLRQQKVDEQQQYLMTLQGRIKQLEDEMNSIHYHLKNEQSVAIESIEGTLAYVRYSGNLNSRLHQLQRFYKEAFAQYQIEQQKLQDLFGEFKVVETYNETLKKQTLVNKARRQQSFLDDLYGMKKQ